MRPILKEHSKFEDDELRKKYTRENRE